MRTIHDKKSYNAPIDLVFKYIDDLGVTGMHMMKSSFPMMGGSLNFEYLTPHHTGLHTKYRWMGKVLFWRLNFTVEVTKWLQNKEKTWESVGNTKMIIYSWFQMNLKMEPLLNGCIARLSISYQEPKGFLNKILCLLVGNWYSKWCLSNMLNDTQKKISNMKKDTID